MKCVLVTRQNSSKVKDITLRGFKFHLEMTKNLVKKPQSPPSDTLITQCVIDFLMTVIGLRGSWCLLPASNISRLRTVSQISPK